MTTLDDVLRWPPSGDLVIGTYLWPLRVFGDAPRHRRPMTEAVEAYEAPRLGDPLLMGKVIRHVEIGGMTLLVTRIGGLFVRPPANLHEPFGPVGQEARYRARKLAFQEQEVANFNLFACELTLSGLLTEPISGTHVHGGNLVDGYAFVTTHAGAIESDPSRAQNVARSLREKKYLLPYEQEDEIFLDLAAKQEVVSQLVAISPLLPRFVNGAYWHHLVHNLAEAAIDAWVTVEQILDFWWNQYIATLEDKRRAKRLADQRTYTTAVRLEVLLSTGMLNQDIYDLFNAAREVRNKLVHRAQIGGEETERCLDAMQAAIEKVVGHSVKKPFVANMTSW